MEDGCTPGLKTYDLLMGKLVAHNRVDKANALYKEAKPKSYMVQPRYAKKKPTAVKEKKRETLPDKMARKRRRLKKLRLSYVEKPKRLARGKKDFGKNVPCDVSCLDKIWVVVTGSTDCEILRQESVISGTNAGVNVGIY